MSTTAHYEVTVDATRLELRVAFHLIGDAAHGDVPLRIPTWVPGDYTFFQLARYIETIEVVDEAEYPALNLNNASKTWGPAAKPPIMRADAYGGIEVKRVISTKTTPPPPGEVLQELVF